MQKSELTEMNYNRIANSLLTNQIHTYIQSSLSHSHIGYFTNSPRLQCSVMRLPGAETGHRTVDADSKNKMRMHINFSAKRTTKRMQTATTHAHTHANAHTETRTMSTASAGR